MESVAVAEPKPLLVCCQCGQRKPRAPGTFAGNRGLCPECYSGRPKCLHCKRRIRRTSGGSRGLCYGCFYTPQIRNLYPPDAKHGKRTAERVAAGTPLPEAPTQAEPGSEAKIAEMQRRHDRRRQLHHPKDRVHLWRLPDWLVRVWT